MIAPSHVRLIFVTGTDTGVGKTLLTALLLRHLRSSGVSALALKPFCSGTRRDVSLLRALQDRDLTPGEINPFYFAAPVAPLVAARRRRRAIRAGEVLRHIQNVAARLEATARLESNHRKSNALSAVLLIEGAGGLLAPLGEGFTARELIARLHCDTLIAARNRLGTINHTLLTIQALQHETLGSSRAGKRLSRRRSLPVKVVLMDQPNPDCSGSSNARVLAKLLAPVPLLRLPFLGPNRCTTTAVKESAVRVKGTLEEILS